MYGLRNADTEYIGLSEDVGVSLNGGTPKSSILIGFSIIDHPIWGTTIFWKHPCSSLSLSLAPSDVPTEGAQAQTSRKNTFSQR